MKNENNIMRLIVGLILIVFGGLFLLDNYGIINFSLPDFLWHWEYILIAIGIVLFVTHGNKTAGTILIVIGFLNLFPEFWPLLIVALGIYIIMKRNPVSSAEPSKDVKIENNSSQNDLIDDISVFGGGTKTYATKNFKGGKLTAIFGGAELHLENSSLAQGKNVIDLFVMFGGYTVNVPHDWNIVIDVIPIFGGFSDERLKDPNRVYEEDKVLIIKGLVIFGGGEVKN
ncbi:MAG: hypothetical protein CR986_08905 [Ignavibacteriae bacterium]|nr:MAG: hypothetical protein CR986_08905 [Ignavibacteriota bacterium]